MLPDHQMMPGKQAALHRQYVSVSAVHDFLLWRKRQPVCQRPPYIAPVKPQA